MVFIPTPKSSNISGHDYDQGKQVLTIAFKNGGKYSYANVSPEKYSELQKAESIGSYHAKNIMGFHKHTKHE